MVLLIQAIRIPGFYRMCIVNDAEFKYERLRLIAGIEDITQPVIQPWGIKAFC